MSDTSGGCEQRVMRTTNRLHLAQQAQSRMDGRFDFDTDYIPLIPKCTRSYTRWPGGDRTPRPPVRRVAVGMAAYSRHRRHPLSGEKFDCIDVASTLGLHSRNRRLVFGMLTSHGGLATRR